MTMRTHDGQPIAFAEWGYIGKGKFQRRDFRFDVLTGSSAFSAEGDLFGHRNVSTTLRQWHLDFRLDFPPFALVG